MADILEFKPKPREQDTTEPDLAAPLRDTLLLFGVDRPDIAEAVVREILAAEDKIESLFTFTLEFETVELKSEQECELANALKVRIAEALDQKMSELRRGTRRLATRLAYDTVVTAVRIAYEK